MEKSISRILAEFSYALRYEDLSQDSIFAAKRFLFDSLGCAYGAVNTKDVKIMRSFLFSIGGSPHSSVIGLSRKLPAPNAALLNSLMVRSLDFNDIYWKQDPVHPSDLIPAVLACAELSKSSMREVISGIVAAYEIEQRLAEFATPGIRERKWHHATLTAFASAFVSGKMLNLSVDEIISAAGISGSRHFTSGCPTAGNLTMMKNTVDPLAVQSGVFAALIAKRGYTGTEQVFEGKEGFMEVLLGWDSSRQCEIEVKVPDRNGNLPIKSWSYNISAITDIQNIKDYRINSCSMKAFPTEALTHTHISAALKLVTENDINYRDIESVTVTTIARACDILFDPHKYNPQSRETADHSLPFCLASALIDQKITTESFSEENISRPEIRQVMNKIKGEASVEFEMLFPEKQPSRIKIKTNDGKVFSQYLEYPKGDPREPMTEEDLDNKFYSLASGVITDKKFHEIKSAVYNCENVSISEFMSILKIKEAK